MDTSYADAMLALNDDFDRAVYRAETAGCSKDEIVKELRHLVARYEEDEE